MTLGAEAPRWDRLVLVPAPTAKDKIARLAKHPQGSANRAVWKAEDGWIVVYSTASVLGGTMHGKFFVQVIAKIHPTLYQVRYERTFSQRKRAKARAEQLYADHSPEWAVRNGY